MYSTSSSSFPTFHHFPVVSAKVQHFVYSVQFSRAAFALQWMRAVSYLHFQKRFEIPCVPDEFPFAIKTSALFLVPVWHGIAFSSVMVLGFDSPVSKMHSMFLAFKMCAVLEEDDDDAVEDGLRVAFRME